MVISGINHRWFKIQGFGSGQVNLTFLCAVCVVCMAPNNRNTPASIWVRCHKPVPVCTTGSNSEVLHTPFTRIPEPLGPKLIQCFYGGFYTGSKFHGSGELQFQSNWNIHVIPAPARRPCPAACIAFTDSSSGVRYQTLILFHAHLLAP